MLSPYSGFVLALAVAGLSGGCFTVPSSECMGDTCGEETTSSTGTTADTGLSMSTTDPQPTSGTPTTTTTTTGTGGTTATFTTGETTDATSIGTGTTSDGTGGSTTGGPASHQIFTTEAEFVGGSIGSLAAADTFCGVAAADGRPWRAVLSDGATSAQDRIDIVGPVMNMLDELVAADADEFWSGTAQAIVGYDENAVAIPGTDLTWVGSSVDHCTGWTNASPDDSGAFGVQDQEDTWLGVAGTFPCDFALHIYCVSQ